MSRKGRRRSSFCQQALEAELDARCEVNSRQEAPDESVAVPLAHRGLAMRSDQRTTHMWYQDSLLYSCQRAVSVVPKCYPFGFAWSIDRQPST